MKFHVVGGWQHWYNQHLLTVCGGWTSGGSVEKEGIEGDYLCSHRFIQERWSKPSLFAKA